MPKKLISVQQDFTVNQGNDPTSPIIGYTDLALLLSNYYGKNIRQGNTFNLLGYSAHLSCDSQSDDADTGLSVQGQSQYVPTTKHSRSAWNHQFQRWSKQKALSGNIGMNVRNDDMEMAFDSTGQTSRTSTLYAGGLGDSDGAEKLVLTGTSATGSRSSLTDLYNSLNPIHQNSKTEFGGNIKEPKFLDKFPAIQSFGWTAHASSSFQWSDLQDDLTVVDSMEADPDSVHYMGASSHSDFIAFPNDSYLPILAGLIKHVYYVLPPDVDTGDNPPAAEDDWTVTITFYIDSWTPLIYKKKTRKAVSKSRRYMNRGRYNARRRYNRRR
jgi:hypothetical protein